MKNILLSMVNLLFAGAAFAQSMPANTITITPGQADTEKTLMKELCNDIRAYNNKRAEAKMDLVKGDFATSKIDFAAADACKQEMETNAALLKTEGIAHPIRLAHKEIKKADVKIIADDVKVVEGDKAAERAAVKAGNTTAVITEKTTIKADKEVLRKDIKAAKRDAGWHIPFIRNNHLSHT